MLDLKQNGTIIIISPKPFVISGKLFQWKVVHKNVKTNLFREYGMYQNVHSPHFPRVDFIWNWCINVFR